MRRALVILAAASVASATAAQSNTATVKAELRARYDALAAAIQKRNVPDIVGFTAPNFSSVNPDGSTFDFASMRAYTERMMGAIDSVIYNHNEIRGVTMRGDTAVVEVCQEFYRLQRIGDAQRRVN